MVLKRTTQLALIAGLAAPAAAIGLSQSSTGAGAQAACGALKPELVNPNKPYGISLRYGIQDCPGNTIYRICLGATQSVDLGWGEVPDSCFKSTGNDQRQIPCLESDYFYRSVATGSNFKSISDDTYLILHDVPGSGHVCTPPLTPPPTSTTKPPANPSMSLKQTSSLEDNDGDKLADPGDTVHYSLAVKNTGNVTLTGLTIQDPGVTAGPSCAKTTLAPAASTTCSASRLVTESDITAGPQISNTATAIANPPAPAQPIRSASATATVFTDQSG